MTSREQQLADLPSGGDAPHRLPLLERVVEPFRRGEAPAPRPATGFYTDTTVCIGCKACEVACKQWNQLPADGFDWIGNSYDNTGGLSATSWRHVKFVEQLPDRDASGIPRADDRGWDGSGSEVLGRKGAGGDGTGRNDTGRDGGGHTGPVTGGSNAGGSIAGASHDVDLLSGLLDPGRWLMMSDVCKHCVAAPCQHACPTGAIVYNEFGNVYIQPDICNGCAYCIAACPFGVITRSTIDQHAHKCTLCFDRQRDGLVPACAKACPTASIQFGPIDELKARARERVEDLHRRGVPDAYLYGDEPGESYSALNSFYLLVDRPSVYGLPEQPVNPWLEMKGDYLRAAVSGLVSLLVLLAVLLLAGGPR